MSNENEELGLIPHECCPPTTLTILDIIKVLNELKLKYLGDEISNEIIVNYNNHVDETYYITDEMDGADIREQFNKLPNSVKQTMTKKYIIAGDTSKNFIHQIIRNSNEQYDFFVKDTEIKGSLINTFSIVLIISCALIYFTYYSTTSLRGEIDDTVSSKIAHAALEYLEEKLP